jgi:hypothetical protein
MKPGIPVILKDFVNPESPAFKNGIMIISKKLQEITLSIFMEVKWILWTE